MRVWPTLSLFCCGGCLTVAGLDGDYSVGGGGASSGSGGTGGGSSSSSGTGGGAGSTSSSSGTTSTSSTSGVGGSSGVGGAGGAGGVVGPMCGDGNEDPNEECDDGNTDSLDGCSSSCTIEDPDSCTAAPVIVLTTNQTEVVTGDVTGAIDDIQNSTGTPECPGGAAPGPDHVWVIAPQTNGTLDASLNASYADHWMQIRAGCPGTITLDCDYSGNASTIDDFSLSVQSGTTYYLFVDSYGSQQGPYTLTVTLN